MKRVQPGKPPSLIRQKREEYGWSQMQLAKASGLSYNTIAYAERGYSCTLETAAILSETLGVQILPVEHEKMSPKERMRIRTLIYRRAAAANRKLPVLYDHLRGVKKDER